jgi:hypothetical protein
MLSYPLPFVKGRYVSGKPTKAVGIRLSAHLKYNQYRKLGAHETREDRRIFSQEQDHIHRKNAVDDIMSHTSSRVNYHKFILSPGEHERVEDFRQWTRDMMCDLQERKGIQLHWYAVVQAHEREHTNEPHVHLVLAGAGEDLNTGQMKLVRMDKNDYGFLREQGRERSNFQWYQEIEQQVEMLNGEDKTPVEYGIDRDLERSF